MSRLGDTHNARKVVRYFVDQPFPWIHITFRVTNDEIGMSFIMILHAVVVGSFFINMIGWLTCGPRCEADTAEACEAEVSVALLPHIFKVESAEEERKLLFSSRNRMSQKDIEHLHLL